jgi:hypothetical protein
MQANDALQGKIPTPHMNRLAFPIHPTDRTLPLAIPSAIRDRRSLGATADC